MAITKTLARWLWPLLPWAHAAALGQDAATVQTAEVRAQLIAHAPEGVAAGKPLALGLLLRHAPQWHTYWINPGDSGLPTTLNWTLPAGVTAGAIDWPAPKRLPVGPLVNYGYEGTVLLPVPVAVTPAFGGDTLAVALRAEWLVCKEVCIPQSGEFRLSLPAAASHVEHAAGFDAARAHTPRRLAEASVQATVDAQALSLAVAGLPRLLQGQAVDFFAAEPGVIDHAARIGQRWDGERLLLRVPLSAQRSEAPATMHAVLTTAADPQGVALRFAVTGWPAIGSATPAAEATAATDSSAPNAAFGVTAALGFAFAGGLLLNLMPCVFPVLSLKVLGFARQRSGRRALAAGGLAYTVGVVLSFVGLAAAMLALRAAGEHLGWGFQLQSPPFVAALALLFTLIGLNLLGVFEVGQLLPGRVAALRSRHPLIDHGFTGVLAVAVTSPCTAPLMGAALGAALSWPAALALAVFAALGLGMAMPYLAACLWPGLQRVLPKPGAWMVRLRTAMAFPMFATVVWLVWVLGRQLGIDGAAALLALLVALAFALWVWFNTSWRTLAGAGGRAAALMALWLVGAWLWPALEDAPAALSDAQPNAAGANAAASAWQPWSAATLASARAEGRPVLVDFTAAWCVTCQLNKRLALADAALLAEFRRRQVLLLRADWTRRDAAITDALRRLGRSGVPVYAWYGPGAREPVLLPEILTVAELRAAMARGPDSVTGGDADALKPRLP